MPHPIPSAPSGQRTHFVDFLQFLQQLTGVLVLEHGVPHGHTLLLVLLQLLPTCLLTCSGGWGWGGGDVSMGWECGLER